MPSFTRPRDNSWIEIRIFSPITTVSPFRRERTNIMRLLSWGVAALPLVSRGLEVLIMCQDADEFTSTADLRKNRDA